MPLYTGVGGIKGSVLIVAPKVLGSEPNDVPKRLVVDTYITTN